MNFKGPARTISHARRLFKLRKLLCAHGSAHASSPSKVTKRGKVDAQPPGSERVYPGDFGTGGRHE
jgi:hypothetical protein